MSTFGTDYMRLESLMSCPQTGPLKLRNRDNRKLRNTLYPDLSHFGNPRATMLNNKETAHSGSIAQ